MFLQWQDSDGPIPYKPAEPSAGLLGTPARCDRRASLGNKTKVIPKRQAVKTRHQESFRLAYLPEILKKARVAHGFTQGGLAQRVGVGKQTVVQYESGKTTPSREMLIRLAEALDLDPVELQGETQIKAATTRAAKRPVVHYDSYTTDPAILAGRINIARIEHGGFASLDDFAKACRIMPAEMNKLLLTRVTHLPDAWVQQIAEASGRDIEWLKFGDQTGQAEGVREAPTPYQASALDIARLEAAIILADRMGGLSREKSEAYAKLVVETYLAMVEGRNFMEPFKPIEG